MWYMKKKWFGLPWLPMLTGYAYASTSFHISPVFCLLSCFTIISYTLYTGQFYTHVYTVEPVFKGHPIGHKNVVCQDRWSLVWGSVILKCGSFCQNCVVFQDRWSHGSGLPREVSLYRLLIHCFWFILHVKPSRKLCFFFAEEGGSGANRTRAFSIKEKYAI